VLQNRHDEQVDLKGYYKREYERIQDTFGVVNKQLSAAQEQLVLMREAIESDAAKEAYEVGLGVSEWEAFLGPKTCIALNATTEQAEVIKREWRNKVIGEFVNRLEARFVKYGVSNEGTIIKMLDVHAEALALQALKDGE
jgi:hypothetical protein